MKLFNSFTAALGWCVLATAQQQEQVLLYDDLQYQPDVMSVAIIGST